MSCAGTLIPPSRSVLMIDFAPVMPVLIADSTVFAAAAAAAVAAVLSPRLLTSAKASP